MKIVKLILPSIIMISILLFMSFIMFTEIWFALLFPAIMYIALGSAIDGCFISENCDGYFLVAIICYILEKKEQQNER